MQNEKTFCELCGASCDERFKIIIRNNSEAKDFCQACFNKLSNMSSKNMRKEIKNRK